MNIFRDLIYPVVGASLIVAGVSIIYKPAGMIVGGLILLAIAFRRSRSPQ
jgi:hypothetical protein